MYRLNLPLRARARPPASPPFLKRCAHARRSVVRWARPLLPPPPLPRRRRPPARSPLEKAVRLRPTQSVGERRSEQRARRTETPAAQNETDAPRKDGRGVSECRYPGIIRERRERRGLRFLNQTPLEPSLLPSLRPPAVVVFSLSGSSARVDETSGGRSRVAIVRLSMMPQCSVNETESGVVRRGAGPRVRCAAAIRFEVEGRSR